MSQNFNEAVEIIMPQVSQDMIWFAPSDEKHFDPVPVVEAVSVILLSAYLSGFLEEARSSAKAFGRTTYHSLERAIKNVFSNETPANPEADDLKSNAEEAIPLIQNMEQGEVNVYKKRSEKILQTYLEARMPDETAIVLLESIRQTITIHILQN